MRWLAAIAGGGILAGAALWAGLTWPAPGGGNGETGRLLYLHLPAAINALAGFLLAGVASAVYLWRRTDRADRLARAAAGAGLVMATATLASGMIWAKLAWGHYWDFKSYRLTFSLVLWILFAAYFLLRAGLGPGARQRRVAAAYCLIACLDVPLVYLSTRLFAADLHPPAPETFAADQAKLALALGFAAVTATSALLLAAFFSRATTADRQLEDAAR